MVAEKCPANFATLPLGLLQLFTKFSILMDVVSVLPFARRNAVITIFSKGSVYFVCDLLMVIITLNCFISQAYMFTLIQLLYQLLGTTNINLN